MDSGATSGPIRREHSHEEWEQQRSLIKQLYIDQDKTLPKVMSAMEERGFYATWVLSYPHFSFLVSANNHEGRSSTRTGLKRGN
jgi:hypothetical protein